MTEDLKSRTEAAVPKPEGVNRLSEDEKRSLEIEGEIEHTDGMEREKLAEQAEENVTGKDAHSGSE